MAKIIKGQGLDKTNSQDVGSTVPDPVPDTGGVVHKRVLDAHDKARAIIDEASVAANKIRKDAEKVLADAKIASEDAIKRGYASGESKGLAQVTEKLLAVEQLKERFFENAEPEIIKLVMTIAEMVIGRAITENPELIKSVVKQALEKEIGEKIVVRLNPKDYKTMMAAEAEFQDIIDRTKRITFKEDETISRGGCVVETEVGTIDAELETQLKAIRNALGL